MTPRCSGPVAAIRAQIITLHHCAKEFMGGVRAHMLRLVSIKHGRCALLQMYPLWSHLSTGHCFGRPVNGTFPSHCSSLSDCTIMNFNIQHATPLLL